MVWNTSSSTLYKAVERHNNADSSASKQEEKYVPPKGYTNPQPPERDCRFQQIQQGNPLAGLLRDRDSLLITALILILLNEKADMKLILALAFVLLG